MPDAVRMHMPVRAAAQLADELVGELDGSGRRVLDQLWLRTALYAARRQVRLAERDDYDARADRLLEALDPERRTA